MKKEITLLAISMFVATGINAQQELTVTHTTAGAMEAEINAGFRNYRSRRDSDFDH